MSVISPRWPGRWAAGSALNTTGMPSVPASSRRVALLSSSSTTGEQSGGKAWTKWFCMSWINSAARAGSIVQGGPDGGTAERSGMG
ncbi:hypothetical protein ACRJ4W_25070 [Streptomyces sp. GLT-R25]|jgi:hypothetical protein